MIQNKVMYQSVEKTRLMIDQMKTWCTHEVIFWTQNRFMLDEFFKTLNFHNEKKSEIFANVFWYIGKLVPMEFSISLVFRGSVAFIF